MAYEKGKGGTVEGSILLVGELGASISLDGSDAIMYKISYDGKMLSDHIDATIQTAIDKYDDSYALGENSFEELISMGELVDRLSIVNFKLYRLKDQVMDRQNDQEFRSWASVEDVKLVMERARLKKCIDQKLLTMINRVKNGEVDGGFNPEVKKYGK